MTDVSSPALSDMQRVDALATAANAYAVKGWQVNVVGFQATLTKKKRIGLIGNVLLTLITGGLWLIYVIYRALNRKSKTVILRVDVMGNVSKA